MIITEYPLEEELIDENWLERPDFKEYGLKHYLWDISREERLSWGN